MWTKILELSVKHRLWVFTSFLFIAVLGALSAFKVPIDAVPDITNVQVMINTKTHALDPGRIEKLITYPIETEMTGLPGVEEVRSLSKYGLSQVIVIFAEGTDIYFARQLISERLQSVRESLPEGISPSLGPVTTGLGEVLMYVLEPREGSELAKKSEKDKLLYLREMQDFVIRPQLKKLDGVADVDTNGGYLKQIHINFHPKKLSQFGISVENFIAKIETMGESYGGGYIQRDGQQIIVRTSAEIDSVETISQLPLSLSHGGKMLRIGDVADVSVDHALRVGAVTHAGHETVMGVVLMRSGANSRQVATAAEQAIQSQIQVPEDIEVKVLYSRSYLVDATIKTVLLNLLEGAVLVVVILLLLLGNLRAAMVVALAIPLSMLFALRGMHFFGISANLMSLGAIDFGLLVDASVVLVENIVRRFEREQGRTIDSRLKLQIVLEASREVLKPVIFGLIIIMLVYVPILYLQGIEGKMFQPMAATVLLALAGSLLVAVLLMPALAYYFIPTKIAHGKEPWLFQKAQLAYRPLLNRSLSSKWIAPSLTVVPLIIAVGMFFQLGADFIPQLDERDMVINLTRSSTMGIDESVKMQKQAEEVIARYSEVEFVFARMGTPESALDPMGPYLADTIVILKKDISQWPLVNGKRRSKEELFEAIREELEKLAPDQEVSLNQPIEMRFNEILEGSRADVSLRIFGPDLEQLFEYAEKAEKILKDLPGISSMEQDPLTALTRSPVLNVQLNYEQLARYGIALKDINSIVETAMSGKEVGAFYQGDRRFSVVMHLEESLRNQIEHISAIPVGLPQGGTVPLSALVKIEENMQVTTVARSGSRRYSAISIFLKDRDVGRFVKDAQAKMANDLQLAPDYELSWGGQFKNLEKASAHLMVIVPITLAVIFVLLLQSFGNFRHALLVFSAIPFAMSGGVFSLYLRGIHFSMSAAIGFIALAGIAVLNSMVLVSCFNQLRAEGLPLREVVARGAMARLRPVLMTALVAGLGFLPMALNTGTGAEVQRPLATVVVGGLITSTLLTLIVIPTVYKWIESRGKPKEK